MSDDDERYDSDVKSEDEVAHSRPKKRVSHRSLEPPNAVSTS